MRKLISFVLAGCLSLGLAACTGTEKKETTAAQTQSSIESASETAESSKETESTSEEAELTSREEESSSEAEGSEELSSDNEEESMAVSNAELSDIIEKIYEEKPVDISLADIPVSFTSEYDFKAYTGLELEEADKLDAALVSEAMISAQAYSMTLVKVKDGSDVSDIAQKMADGIDQRKWICVEADDLQVVSKGDVIMLVMVDSQLSEVATSQELVDAFEKVMGGIDAEYVKKN